MRHLSLALRAFFPSPGVAGAPTCKYHPTCSEYASLAFRELGLVRGTIKTTWRLLRCNPWSHGGVDYPRAGSGAGPPSAPRPAGKPRRQRRLWGPAVIVAGILSPIENALAWLLEHLHDPVGLSWGWSIVALTIIVRICLVPIMVKQIHSMQRMQAHLPEMKAIQQKYKGDRQRLNEELMKFYKENEINPAASCLPMVVQIPVFFALYFVLRNFSNHVNAPVSELHWLIVPDITDHVTEHWSGYVLLVLYLGSQVGYAYFGTPPNIPRSQRILFMVVPFFILPFVSRFPVGLLMYWMTTNLWTVGQGIITRRMVPKPAPPPKRSSRTPPKEEPAALPTDGAGESGAPAQAAAVRSGAPNRPRRVKRKKRKGGR